MSSDSNTTPQTPTNLKTNLNKAFDEIERRNAELLDIVRALADNPDQAMRATLLDMYRMKSNLLYMYILKEAAIIALNGVEELLRGTALEEKAHV